MKINQLLRVPFLLAISILGPALTTAHANICVENHNSGAIVNVAYGNYNNSISINQWIGLKFIPNQNLQLQGLPNGNTVVVSNLQDKDYVEITGYTEWGVKANVHPGVCSSSTSKGSGTVKGGSTVKK